MDDDFLIECIENEIESSNYDFKKDIYDFEIQESKEDFLTDVISFANSHANGSKYIITGVKLYKDKPRDIKGINEQKIKDGADYQSLVNDNIEPNIIIDFKTIDYKGSKFGIFKIDSTNNDQPYLLSKQYGKLPKGYIRIRKGQKNEYISRRDFDIFYKEKDTAKYSNINLKGIINRKISDTFEIKKYENPIDLKKAKETIEKLFNELNSIELIKSSKSTIKMGLEVSIQQQDIDIIQKYAKENHISLQKDFFDIGNLTYFSIPYSATQYYGTETEKKKYKLIDKLSETISIFEGFMDFYGKISKIFYTELAIKNTGKQFDEDIEVTLKIKAKSLYNLDDFPIPSESIIEIINDNDIIKKYLSIDKNYGILDEIEYEIRTKFNPNIQKGRILKS